MYHRVLPDSADATGIEPGMYVRASTFARHLEWLAAGFRVGTLGDLFDDPPPRRGRKKTRGVPFSASDEDISLFEESRGGRKAKAKSTSRTGKKTDPFARARKAIKEEQGRSPRNGRTSSRRTKRKSKTGRGGSVSKGDGDHGLVLSRISDPDKKEKAAELIAEIKGCSIDSAHRLTDRTIIPVLKGVTRDVAEFHLDKFKRYRIAGRVTTRQRG